MSGRIVAANRARAERLRDQRRHDPLPDRHAAAAADRPAAGERPDRGDGGGAGEEADAPAAGRQGGLGRASGTAAASGSPEAAIEGFLAKYDPAIASQLRACRRTIRALVPRGFEMVYDNYNGLVFGFSPTERPSDALLSIVGYPRWVGLAFLQGARSPIPTACSKARAARSAACGCAPRGISTSPRSRALIARALAPEAGAFTAAPPLRTILKSVSAKQRPRR